jgi:hypothetical protein
MLQQVYVPVSWAYARLFSKNPKKHDIGAICQSIIRNGFRDPPAFDINLKSNVAGEEGAIAYGNGRIEALYYLEKDGFNSLTGLRPDEAPGLTEVELVLGADGIYRPGGKGEAVRVPFIQGLAIGEAGEWLMPVVFGADAQSRAQAEAFVIDHNNLTMAGGEFTALDMSRMYNMEDYLKLLEGLRVEDDLPETVDADDLALLFEAMAGAFDGAGDDGGEDGEDGSGADDAYTKKVDSPNYEPREEKPEFSQLFDKSRADELAAEIKAAGLSAEDEAFLLQAAQRHCVFNYQRIADYYAHSNEKVQKLMEDSALVIIDFDRAIELGYVKLSEEIAAQYLVDVKDA